MGSALCDYCARCGVEAQIVHIPSDFIGACIPSEVGSLTGDKAVSVVFDNSKIKRFVPRVFAKTPFAQGIQRTIEWFDADESRKQIDEDAMYPGTGLSTHMNRDLRTGCGLSDKRFRMRIWPLENILERGVMR